MDIFLVKNHWVIAVELEKTVFQAARLLLWHCCLVFKLDSLLSQRFGYVWTKNYISSLTSSTYEVEYADHVHVILMQQWRGKGVTFMIHNSHIVFIWLHYVWIRMNCIFNSFYPCSCWVSITYRAVHNLSDTLSENSCKNGRLLKRYLP